MRSLMRQSTIFETIAERLLEQTGYPCDLAASSESFGFDILTETGLRRLLLLE